MTTKLLTLALLSLVSFACGDSGSGGAGGQNTGAAGGENTGAGSTGGDGVGGAGGSGIPSCNEPTAVPGAVNDVAVDSVAAAADDENGDPITNFPLQLCGKDFCINADSSAVGTVAFTNTQASGNIDRPMFKPGDSLTYGKIGYPYTPAGPSPLQGVFPTMTDSGTQFAPGETASAAGVELTMPADGGVLIDSLIYDEPAKTTFRAGKLAAADVAAATGSADFSMVYALGPHDTVFCPGVSMTFDNYGGLAADTAVEFWGQVLSAAEYHGGYGEWVKLGEGAVSSDGATVVTDAAGLEVLLTIAIKAK